MNQREEFKKQYLEDCQIVKPDHTWISPDKTWAVYNNPRGFLCGYVALEDGHPLHKILARDTELDASDVLYAHGGLNYHEVYEERFGDKRTWLGFDCGHAWDAKVMEEDSLSLTDEEYRTFEYVKDQCLRLMKQIEMLKGDPTFNDMVKYHELYKENLAKVKELEEEVETKIKAFLSTNEQD